MADVYDYADDLDEPQGEIEAAEPEDMADEEAQPENTLARLQSFIGAVNIAEDLPDDVLTKIGEKVCEEYKIDEDSREASGWKARHDNALKMAMQVKEVKNSPWPKAANVKYPLITVAAMQFAARAYPAIVDGANVVKGKVLGKPDDAKRDRADRIARHMSYQLVEEMPEWEEGMDQLLHILPVTGTVYTKSYFDPMKGRNCSELVTADRLVENYWSFGPDPRRTQVCDFYPDQVLSKMRSGLWLDVELGRPQDSANDDNAPHCFLEQHRLWDLDDDGYPEPYIVTVHKETRKVVRIYARFDKSGVKANALGEIALIKPKQHFTKYVFIPSLDNSAMGMGFGTLLDGLNDTINTLTNQLLDSGTLANMQGGFIGAGVSMKSGSMKFMPGEWKKVETTGPALKDALVPLPVQAPSNVLFQLLGMLIEASKDITATKDILTGETQQANTPVGTTLAQIEQGLKVFSSIYKRVHRALKHELGLLYRLNSEYLEPQVYFTFQDDEKAVGLEDYRQGDVDVVPVSDPTVVTDMQRIGRAQFLMQFRGVGLNDMKINERVLEAAGIQDIKELMPEGPPPPNPELELKGRELDLREREVVVKEQTGRADVAQTMADAQKTMLEAVFSDPSFVEKIAQLIDIRVNQNARDAGKPNAPAVQPGSVPAMEGPSPDGGVSPVPPGPAGDPGQGMDGRPAPLGSAPDQGAPLGGASGPGLG